mgnify:CR=1 FL=1|tara:strand:- start:4255 stop:4674 length:420 start_codon:yes stop_codon:yes gene_type:complete
MKVISHRGNINGSSDSENHPVGIVKVLEMGLDCEVDVWRKDGAYWLGHDNPLYEVSIDFLKNDRLWCHAKNLNALESMLSDQIHCFWHQEDDFTLTSKGYIWTYPEKITSNKSVIVQKGKDKPPEKCHGICTDYPKFYL